MGTWKIGSRQNDALSRQDRLDQKDGRGQQHSGRPSETAKGTDVSRETFVLILPKSTPSHESRQHDFRQLPPLQHASSTAFQFRSTPVPSLGFLLLAGSAALRFGGIPVRQHSSSMAFLFDSVAVRWHSRSMAFLLRSVPPRQRSGSTGEEEQAKEKRGGRHTTRRARRKESNGNEQIVMR